MCGLFGMGGYILPCEVEIFERLMLMSSFRGQDSTGIALSKIYADSPHNHSEIFKDTTSPQKFIHELNSFPGYKKRETNFYLGHSRWATRGVVNLNNAHPFRKNHIVGTHNGTLIDKKYKSSELTDSELLIKDISEFGYMKVLTKLSVKSAYAVALIDEKRGELILARNDARPLWYYYNRVYELVVYSSDPRMISLAIEDQNLGSGQIEQVEANTALVFPFNDKGSICKPSEFSLKISYVGE